MGMIGGKKLQVSPGLLIAIISYVKVRGSSKKGIITWSLDLRWLYCNKDSKVCEHIKMKIVVLLPEKIPALSMEDRLYPYLVLRLQRLGLFRFVFSALVDYLRFQLGEFGRLTFFRLRLIVFRGW